MTITLKLNSAAGDAFARRSLSDISLSVAKCKRIVVVTGAGISCSCGIPDFRSSDGLYALVKQQYPDVVLKGRDLFDASLFRDATSTAVFYTFISQLKQSIDSATPTPTHRFLKTLDSKKKLLRSYTQNIDGLEARAGLIGSSSQEVKIGGKGGSKIKAKDVRNVQLHGDIHRVRCVSCSAEYPCTHDHMRMFDQGSPPDCPECLSRSEARLARSARPIKVGTLRPAIVLYDEPHPLGDDIGSIQSMDLGRKPDMLIIMGTSLKVHGLKKLVKEFARAVHASAPSPSSSTSKVKSKPWAGKVIFVNRTPPGTEWSDIIDYHVAGETDPWVTKVIEDWRKYRPADWEIQQTLVAADGDVSMSGGFKAVKEIVPSANKNGKGKADVRKKKPLRNENRPPTSLNMLLSPDIVFTKISRGAIPPLSPSKRRRAVSQTSIDMEGSPSKKHATSDMSGVLEDSERKLLFAESTNHILGTLGEKRCSISQCRMWRL
ncbi:DHS-like NAD/FAD-binding domain-containing protein [Infundibulicybe gibba]|nr:DHS-like NAD/FAD-binding domain-containing protein [Infundibulicybe gibba]